MSYKITFSPYISDLKIFYLVNDNTLKVIDYLQYTVSYDRWIITGRQLIDSIPDLSTLTEEEYFQLSLLWDYKFPIELVLKIMTVSKKCDYNFFKVKTILHKDGIVL